MCHIIDTDFDCLVQVWDVTRGEKVGSLVGHENRVSCLGVSNDAISLCTGSWDAFVSFFCQMNCRAIANSHIAQGLGLLGPLIYADTTIDLDLWIPGPISRLGWSSLFDYSVSVSLLLPVLTLYFLRPLSICASSKGVISFTLAVS